MLDTRAAVRWLRNAGYERIGILGTSIGSCISFLAFAHDQQIVMPELSITFPGYVADVAWHGLSTSHVREGFADHLTLDELRDYWGRLVRCLSFPEYRTWGIGRCGLSRHVMI